MSKQMVNEMSYIQRLLIDLIVRDIICYMMKYQNVSIIDALDMLYNSEIFKELEDVETGLYQRGSSYVYVLFCREMIDRLKPPDIIADEVYRKQTL